MKMFNSLILKLSFFSLLMLGFSTSLQAQDEEPIGLMLSTSGVVTAEDLDGNVRRLQRRSPVFEGDTLITNNRARAQVRFNDRGLIALQPNTSFFIEEHNFEGQEDGTESAVYSLLRGGLQAITGLIGHNNRDRYQVSTPIATIGLRGTHWAATFCTTACDGNPPGLYGGVADGGIDVCNGGGCTAVETSTYFYTPNANTRATTLLAPPSVVFATTEDDEEEEGEEGGEVAETDASDEGAGEGDAAEPSEANVAAFVERAAANAGVTPAEFIQAVVDAGRVDDLIDAVAQRTEQVVEADINPDSPTTAAPLGSVAVLASARELGADQTGALDILLFPSGTDDSPRAALIDVDGTTALAALDFNRDSAGCAPCLYATAGINGTSAVLAESIEATVDGVDIFMGRWLGSALLTNTTTNLNALQNHHYALALAGEGSSAYPSSLSANAAADRNVVAKFSLLNATSPTDAAGVTGTLDRADLYLDLFDQVITAIELDISFADERQIFASLVAPFRFAEGSATGGLFAELAGECFGGSCGQFTEISGDTSLSFIGSSAEHILGGYALDTEALDMSVFGTYLLGQIELIEPIEPGEENPPGYVLNPVASFPAGGVTAVTMIGISDGEYAPIGTLTNYEDTAIGVISLDGNTNIVVSIDDIGDLDEEGGSFFITEGVLAEYSETSNTAFTASLGRWDLYSSELFLDGSIRSTTTDGHFAYSEDPTDLDLLDFDFNAPILRYSLSDATAPSDQDGNLGVLNSLSIEINLVAQLITQFSLDIDIGDTMYLAGLSGPSMLGDDDEVRLFGTCSGGDCGTDQGIFGIATLSFLGDGAEGVLGNYGLVSYEGNVPPRVDDENDGFDDQFFSDLSVNGVYLAGRDSVTDAPTNIFPSFDTPAMAKYVSIDNYQASDDQGLTGEIKAEMELDLFTQTLRHFELNVNIGDRQYFAESLGFSEVSPSGAGKTSSQVSNVVSAEVSGAAQNLQYLGIDFEDLLDGSLLLAGICEGGDCAAASGSGTDIYGNAYLNPFGAQGEGFMGDFDLIGSLSSGGPLEVGGEFVLAQQEIVDHIGWQVGVNGAEAVSGSVATISGTLAGEMGSLPKFTSFALLADLSAGDDFTAISFLDEYEFDGQVFQSEFFAVDSLILDTATECDICEFEVQNAVVLDLGEVFHEYQYLGENSGASWATWGNQDLADNEWLFDGSDPRGPLESNRLLSTVYSSELTSAGDLAAAEPLTGFVDMYSYEMLATYHYAGGPAPVSEAMDFGDVDTINLTVDFYDQEIDNFYADFGFYADGIERFVSLNLDAPGAISLAPTMSLELIGTCSACGSSSSDNRDMEGLAELAFIGTQAEQVIGSLAAWSEEYTDPVTSVVSPEGTYTVENSFVLNQAFDRHWVDLDWTTGTAPFTEPAPDGGAVAFSALAWDEVEYVLDPVVLGFQLKPANAAQLINVIDTDHSHPNSVVAFDVGDASGCAISCTYQVSEGQLGSYDNSNAPSLAHLPDAYWGRWETQDDIEIDGTVVSLTEFQHWAYSPDPSDKSGAIWSSSNEYMYKYLPGSYGGATSPTDFSGNEGYLNSIYMTLDFSTQEITSFDLSATVDSMNYDVNLVSSVMLDGDASAIVQLENTSTYLYGEASIGILGSEADAALGAYGITDGSYFGVNGAFLLENYGIVGAE